MTTTLFEFQTNSSTPSCTIKSGLVNLEKPDIRLFNETAKSLAEEMSKPELLKEEKDKRTNQKTWKIVQDNKANKITQIRKFYDEVCMWETKCKNEEVFSESLPFIKMLNAKAAYARGREYVDDKFVAMISACLTQINEPTESGLKTFKNFKVFFEAFYGFYRAIRTKD